ncbi:hypothetical protein [Stagnihabitans tardus]|uniref:3-methylfumaryl-CoA hydratase n=1 Tax=Stagnihabitans tardus TaxID=2699202 RepID=A0AAE5BTY6_9RHOB|nr:hypothetical protein [Stagnihabitans tardus]NBZ89585.1 hypothetical protein [Stagnihabitans tardus]
MPVDIFTLAQAQRVAVMLGRDPLALADGDPVPRGWHFAMLAGLTPRRLLRSDGFPGLGVVMPQLDLPRLVLGGRSTIFHGDLVIGAGLRRESSLASVEAKTGKAGPFAVARIDHRLTSGAAEITETQTYILAGPPAPAPKPAPITPPEGRARVVTPDDLMLFQYSALGFNTHRIHFDRDHARSEGHPDLVVNGGLASLLALEFLRDLGLRPASMSARHMAPLYVNRPLTLLVADARVLILDDEGVLAAELVMTFDDL